jgi:hypothetical protein
MHARLKEMIAEEPGELVMGPVTLRVDIELGADYQKAHAKALEAMDGQRYFGLFQALESMPATPPLAPLASKPAGKVIPKLVKRDVKRLRRAVQEAVDHPAAPATTRPCTRPGRTANTCGTPPKRQPLSAARRLLT